MIADVVFAIFLTVVLFEEVYLNPVYMVLLFSCSHPYCSSVVSFHSRICKTELQNQQGI